MALNDVTVRTANPQDKQYKLTDDKGLHLLVHTNGSKYWRFRYRYAGKEKMLALEMSNNDVDKIKLLQKC